MLYEVGLFDENYDGRWGVEDLDLGFRLNQNNRKIFLLKEALSIHYPHGKKKHQHNIEGYENLKYFHQKYNTPITEIFYQKYFSGSSESGLIDLHEQILRTAANNGL